MPKISYAKLTLSWRMLNRSVAASVTEPLVEARRRELEAALDEVQERHRRRSVLLVQAAENNRLLREAIARGKEAEARLRAFLKGTYGRESTELIRFGVQPQRKRRRAAPASPDGGDEPPVAGGRRAAGRRSRRRAHARVAGASSAAAPAAARRKPAANTRRRQGARPKRAPAKSRLRKKKVT